MKYVLILSLLSMSAFAQSNKSEAVSVERAEKACGKHSARRAFGAILGGMGGDSRSSINAYNDCVDRHLDVQRANAGIRNTTVRCKTIRVDDYTTQTRCE